MRPCVLSNIDSLILHLRVAHQWSRRPGHQSASYQPTEGLAQAACFPIAYQTFYKRKDFMWYFQVQPGAAVVATAGGIQQGIQQELEGEGSSILVAPALSIPEQIELQLTQKLNAAIAIAATTTTTTTTNARERHRTQASPWLDVTEWPGYLQQHDPLQAARLIRLPQNYANAVALRQPVEVVEPEPQLVLMLDSLDRLVEQARDSLLEGKVNVFD
jgi:hypothetical protein